MGDYELLKRRYEREKNARKQAEQILNQKSTELYLINQELREISDGLEQEVLRRTQDLSRARDQALAAVKAKSDFVANMSHEIRTPLNGVLGIISLLEDTELSDHQRGLLSTAAESGEHLLEVVNDILDFSKIEAGKMELNIEPMNLVSVLNQVPATFGAAAAKKNLSLNLQIPDSVPASIEGDAMRLRQVIYNLVSNAIKFTHQGDVAIRLELEEENYRISVQDSGVGMTPEQQEVVFNAFDQADSSVTRNYGGTGLGLSITHKLIDLMQGTIQLDSEPGVGSCFTVRLPLSPSDTPVAIQPLLQEDVTFSGQTVLLVEDNMVNQTIAIHMLEKLNLAVELCVNGREAVEITRHQRFDAILMDVQMPVMDGLEATRLIRARESNRFHVPIIAMTAHASDQHRVESLDSGMDEHITKPIKVRELGQVLSRFLARTVATVDDRSELSSQLSGSATTGSSDGVVTPNGKGRGQGKELQRYDANAAEQGFNGKLLAFSSALQLILDQHEADMKLLVQAVKSGQWKSARILVSGLQTDASSVKATTLAAAAANLDRAMEKVDQLSSTTSVIASLEQPMEQLHSEWKCFSCEARRFLRQTSSAG